MRASSSSRLIRSAVLYAQRTTASPPRAPANAISGGIGRSLSFTSVAPNTRYSRACQASSQLQLLRPNGAGVLSLEPEFGPNRPGLQRGNQLVRQAPDTVERAHRSRPRRPAAQQARQHAAGGRNDRRQHLFAKTGTQGRTEIADRIGKAERHRGLAGPVFAGEQQVVVALEAAAPAAFDQRNEDGVD